MTQWCLPSLLPCPQQCPIQLCPHCGLLLCWQHGLPCTLLVPFLWSLETHQLPHPCPSYGLVPPCPFRKHTGSQENNGQTGSPCLDKAMLNACARCAVLHAVCLCSMRGAKIMYAMKTCPYLTLTTIGLDWEEDTVQRSVMLNPFFSQTYVCLVRARSDGPAQA